MPHIILEFPEEGLEARVELLTDEAPELCASIVEHLPREGKLQHAIYSGSEVAFLFRPDIFLEMQNQTTCVLPGDVGYYRLEGGVMKGFPNPVTEIAIFYGRDATPRMPDGPVPIAIFGKIVSNLDEFAAICTRMRLEGAKPFRIRVCHSNGDGK